MLASRTGRRWSKPLNNVSRPLWYQLGGDDAGGVRCNPRPSETNGLSRTWEGGQGGRIITRLKLPAHQRWPTEGVDFTLEYSSKPRGVGLMRKTLAHDSTNGQIPLLRLSCEIWGRLDWRMALWRSRRRGCFYSRHSVRRDGA